MEEETKYAEHIRACNSENENTMKRNPWSYTNSNLIESKVGIYVRNCRNNKETGIGSLTYEVLTNKTQSELLYTVLLNECLNGLVMPSRWMKDIINPFLKSASSDPKVSLN